MFFRVVTAIFYRDPLIFYLTACILPLVFSSDTVIAVRGWVVLSRNPFFLYCELCPLSVVRLFPFAGVKRL